jgi:hypothetical protein
MRRGGRIAEALKKEGLFSLAMVGRLNELLEACEEEEEEEEGDAHALTCPWGW